MLQRDLSINNIGATTAHDSDFDPASITPFDEGLRKISPAVCVVMINPQTTFGSEDFSTLPEKIALLIRSLRDEYGAELPILLVVGFTGDKDELSILATNGVEIISVDAYRTNTIDEIVKRVYRMTS